MYLLNEERQQLEVLSEGLVLVNEALQTGL
jgi:hypothetical protein